MKSEKTIGSVAPTSNRKFRLLVYSVFALTCSSYVNAEFQHGVPGVPKPPTSLSDIGGHPPPAPSTTKNPSAERTRLDLVEVFRDGGTPRQKVDALAAFVKANPALIDQDEKSLSASGEEAFEGDLKEKIGTAVWFYLHAAAGGPSFVEYRLKEWKDIEPEAKSILSGFLEREKDPTVNRFMAGPAKTKFDKTSAADVIFHSKRIVEFLLKPESQKHPLREKALEKLGELISKYVRFNGNPVNFEPTMKQLNQIAVSRDASAPEKKLATLFANALAKIADRHYPGTVKTAAPRLTGEEGDKIVALAVKEQERVMEEFTHSPVLDKKYLPQFEAWAAEHGNSGNPQVDEAVNEAKRRLPGVEQNDSEDLTEGQRIAAAVKPKIADLAGSEADATEATEKPIPRLQQPPPRARVSSQEIEETEDEEAEVLKSTANWDQLHDVMVKGGKVNTQLWNSPQLRGERARIREILTAGENKSKLGVVLPKDFIVLPESNLEEKNLVLQVLSKAGDRLGTMYIPRKGLPDWIAEDQGNDSNEK